MERELNTYVCLYCDRKFVAESLQYLRHHDCPGSLADDERLGKKIARFDPVYPEIGKRI